MHSDLGNVYLTLNSSHLGHPLKNTFYNPMQFQSASYLATLYCILVSNHFFFLSVPL